MTRTPRSTPMRTLLASLAVLPALALAACVPSTGDEKVGDRDEERVRAVVTDYLEALADGDAETALDLLGAAPYDVRCPDLVTNEIYGQVSGRPVDGEITGVTLTDGSLAVGRPSASVTVEHVWDGDDTVRRTTITLRRDDGGWGVDDAGTLGLQETGLRPSGGVLALNGACHAGPGELGGVEVLPGTYEVSVEDPSGIGALEPFDHRVPATGSTAADLEARPEVLAEVTDQLTAWIDACGADPAADLTCPDGVNNLLRRLDITERGELEGVALRVYLLPDGWYYAFEASQDVAGTLRVDACIGQGDLCEPGAPRTDLIGYRLTGTLALDDGAVVLTPLRW